MFTAALLIVVQRWKEPWVNGYTVWSSHMVEYYSALKRKGIRTPATMWMDPDTELSEISYTQKDKSCLIPLQGGP